jgi:hypothetical protein
MAIQIPKLAACSFLYDLAMSPIGTNRLLEVGQSTSALPGISDINLFRYCQGIIHFDAQISNRAFDLGVAKQKLDAPEIASATVEKWVLVPANRPLKAA